MGMKIEEFKENITEVMNAFGRYNYDEGTGYDGDYEEIKIDDCINFDLCLNPETIVEYRPDLIEFNLNQALTAYAILNYAKRKWYNKSRDRGLGVNIETDYKTVSEWIEIIESYKGKVTLENWIEATKGDYPDDYSDVDEDWDPDSLYSQEVK